MTTNRTASGLPEPVEDAVQFFLYRVQIGAALAADRLSEETIGGLLEPAAADDRDPETRIHAALAAALSHERAQAQKAARFSAAIGEPHEPPHRLWARHRTALLADAPDSRLRAAVETFEIEPGFLRRLWRSLRGR